MKTHHIYWWNLENLFDIQTSPTRPDWFQKVINKELKGWNTQVLEAKLNNLCSIIQKMNANLGPDILGVCEIENEEVVAKLMAKVTAATGRNYKIMHKDTGDKRGIDIAIIYDADLYIDDDHIFTLEIMKRNATRDLLQINLTTKAGNELVLIGNHWPSRMGGKLESEPYRAMVGEILSYWIERIHEIKLAEKRDKNPAIVIMGDFNDNPYDRSLTEYLRSTGNLEKVKNARSHVLYNLMYEFLDSKYGTHVYGSEVSILDQFMVTKSLIVDSTNYPFQVSKTALVNFPELVKGDYNTPIRFGRPSSSSSFNMFGYSDHLPIELILEERD
jgi:predicted extracellular nuclease